MTDRHALATDNEILRGVVGSTAHGTAIEGQDDRDEMGIFVEPPEYVCGLQKIEQYIYRDQPEGHRSGPGDLDLTIYSLRKFVRLAAQGNPSVLILLWLPRYEIIADPIGTELLKIRDAFVSAEAGRRFLGYLASQRMRLTGERSKKVARPDLVGQHGYDTKFAMHAVRLGYQGIEYITEGRITLPVPERPRKMLLAIRQGRLDLKAVLAEIDSADAHLRSLVNKCDWAIDRSRINRFLIWAHRIHWGNI